MNFVVSPPSGNRCPRSREETVLISDTVRWIERAVIGLNLCPFAKSVHAKGQVHYAVCHSTNSAGVLLALEHELRSLNETQAQQRDTTLLIVPDCLGHFLDFNDFLDESDSLLEALGLAGVLQIASFHPEFRFAGTREDDASNCSNRSPYPTLHLLREDSIDRAVDAFPEAEAIFERNIAVLTELGISGWEALDVGAHRVASAAQDAQA